MTRPYHHGALREALLDEGQLVLAQQGPEAISLRELARRAGVSHSAPERHFANRQALLEALAIRGHTLLYAAIKRALDEHGPRLEDQFRAAATAYVDFAIENGRLLELMVTARAGTSNAALTSAADDVFALISAMLGESGIGNPPASPLRLLVGATLQGIANLAVTHGMSSQDVARVIDEAVAVFVPAFERQAPAPLGRAKTAR
jgi:AcrR family transcriptional regulator